MRVHEQIPQKCYFGFRSLLERLLKNFTAASREEESGERTTQHAALKEICMHPHAFFLCRLYRGRRGTVLRQPRWRHCTRTSMRRQQHLAHWSICGGQRSLLLMILAQERRTHIGASFPGTRRVCAERNQHFAGPGLFGRALNMLLSFTTAELRRAEVRGGSWQFLPDLREPCSGHTPRPIAACTSAHSNRS